MQNWRKLLNCFLPNRKRPAVFCNPCDDRALREGGCGYPVKYGSGYVTAQDMLLGKAEVGKKALVVGGGMVGCEAAKAI